MNDLPEHLGGHAGKTHLFPVVLDHLIKTYNIKTMIDVGCGPAGMVELAREKGIDAIGIDGDWTVERNIEVILHDFTKGPYEIEPKDLAWSVEMVEHIEEAYVPNFMPIFARCKYVLITYAPPGTPGHHHVNCREEQYWIALFASYGLVFDEEATKTIREFPKDYNGKNKKNFVGQRGLFFTNKAF